MSLENIFAHLEFEYVKSNASRMMSDFAFHGGARAFFNCDESVRWRQVMPRSDAEAFEATAIKIYRRTA